MALQTLYDGPLLLNPIVTYLSGPLSQSYISANAVPFPPMTAKLVTIVGNVRTVKLLSKPTQAEVTAANTGLLQNAIGAFLFQQVSETNLKARLSSAQIEEYAKLQTPVFIELVRTSTDPDIDDEPVAIQKISFSGEGISYDATPDPIPFNVNGSTISLVFSLPGAGQTPTVADIPALLVLQSQIADPDAVFDAFVLDDFTQNNQKTKYQVTMTDLFLYNTIPNTIND